MATKIEAGMKEGEEVAWSLSVIGNWPWKRPSAGRREHEEGGQVRWLDFGPLSIEFWSTKDGEPS